VTVVVGGRLIRIFQAAKRILRELVQAIETKGVTVAWPGDRE